jgi:hypothetical protein
MGIQQTVEVINELTRAAQDIFRIIAMYDANALPFFSPIGVVMGIIYRHLMSGPHEARSKMFCQLLESPIEIRDPSGTQDGDAKTHHIALRI